MLKKFFSLVLALSVMLAGSSASAVFYPQNFNGDRNYILFDGIQGVGRYVYAPSLSVDEYAPPRYVISIDWVSVQDGKVSNSQRVTFGYDWDAKTVSFVRNSGEWSQINPDGSRAEGSAFVAAAEIAFCLAYHQKFLGTYPESFYDFMR